MREKLQIRNYLSKVKKGRKSSVSIELMKKITESVGNANIVDTVNHPERYPTHSNYLQFYAENRSEVFVWLNKEAQRLEKTLSEFIVDAVEEACMNISPSDIEQCAIQDNKNNPGYNDVVYCLVESVTFAFLDDLQDYTIEQDKKIGA